MRCLVFQCLSSQKRHRVATDFFNIMIWLRGLDIGSGDLLNISHTSGLVSNCTLLLTLSWSEVANFSWRVWHDIMSEISPFSWRALSQFGVRNCIRLLTHSVTIWYQKLHPFSWRVLSRFMTHPFSWRVLSRFGVRKLHPSLDAFCRDLMSEIAPFSWRVLSRFGVRNCTLLLTRSVTIWCQKLHDHFVVKKSVSDSTFDRVEFEFESSWLWFLIE